MMKLIDRYIYAVTERLPKEAREDVSKELYTNIEDMLSENPAEDEVRTVLEKLGNPRKMAHEYSSVKRYLIGPGLYQDYIAILKLVTSIVATVLVCVTLVKLILNPQTDGNLLQYTVQLVVEILAAVIQGFMQGAVWVTLIFAVIERYSISDGDILFLKKKWTPDDLPTIPRTKKSKISRGKTIISMIGTVIFTTLIYFYPQIFAVYEIENNQLMLAIPLFSIERLKPYILFIIIIAFLQLSFGIWKFISNYWSIPMAAANAVLNTGVCILIVFLFQDNAVFNPAFISKIGSYTELLQVENLSVWFDKAVPAGAVLIIALCLWDSISAFLKCSKQQSIS